MANDSNTFLKKFILILSQALDLLTLRISKHHQRVTLISLKIADELNLKQSDRLTLFYAGLLHDFAIISTKDKLDVMNFDYTNSYVHTEQGYQRLSQHRLFGEIAEVIRYHHDHWLGPNKSGLIKDNIPLLSQIIHLADRMEVLISDDKYVLEQAEQIKGKIIKLSGMWFSPQLVECFRKLVIKEVFWLDLSPQFVTDILDEISPVEERILSVNDIINLFAKLFAEVIDCKSHYTQKHSVTVMEVALKLGKQLNCSEVDLEHLRIAALLHDMGKFSIPDDILEKPSMLTVGEYTIIKKHPYYTYHLLKALPDFKEIAQWAAFHHERMDGMGYPFGLKAESLPLGARIIAVADRFTALSEDRPYRGKLSYEQALRILDSEVNNRMIDGEILNTLKSILAATTDK